MRLPWKILAGAAVAGAVVVSGAGIVDAGKDSAPGQAIKTACNANYGQITSGATTSEEGFVPGQHGKGGANAFSSEGSLAIHCPG
jgi:hypothetical protein